MIDQYRELNSKVVGLALFLFVECFPLTLVIAAILYGLFLWAIVANSPGMV